MRQPMSVRKSPEEEEDMELEELTTQKPPQKKRGRWSFLRNRIPLFTTAPPIDVTTPEVTTEKAPEQKKGKRNRWGFLRPRARPSTAEAPKENTVTSIVKENVTAPTVRKTAVEQLHLLPKIFVFIGFAL
ncbi:hypothetical protein OESDEN_12048 [Oesophagostomum dentatum]|uniref:Uncharacterized protein n=1 Tax=Oesophagostomum dentatum TaxID=61180 RepID=A0A0B1SYD9_OESDE|nr:hypothetical protein OESDEN_12048 [Oesophagostomum dentatum]